MTQNGVVRASSLAGANARALRRGLLATVGVSMLAACAAQTGDFSSHALKLQDVAGLEAAALPSPAGSASTGDNGADADALYRKAMKDHPEMAKSQTPLGQAFLESGAPALALRYFYGARMLDPNNVDNMIGAGLAHMVLQEPQSAQKEFGAALKKEPANIRALNGMGVALDAQKKHRQAQRCYEKVLRQEPGNRAARNNYGLSLGLSGNYSRAISELSLLAQREDEAGMQAKQNLARVYAMRDGHAASQWVQTKTGSGK